MSSTRTNEILIFHFFQVQQKIQLNSLKQIMEHQPIFWVIRVTLIVAGHGSWSCFWLWSSIRAEKSKTRHHFWLEFWWWMRSTLTHESLDSARSYVSPSRCFLTVHSSLETWNVTEPWNATLQSHSNITYDQAIDLFASMKTMITLFEHGDDFGSPHETWISNHFWCQHLSWTTQQLS